MGRFFPLEIGGTPEKLDAKLISKDTTNVAFTIESQLIKLSYKDSNGGDSSEWSRQRPY